MIDPKTISKALKMKILSIEKDLHTGNRRSVQSFLLMRVFNCVKLQSFCPSLKEL